MMLVAVAPSVDGFALDSDNNGIFDSVDSLETVTISKSTTSKSVGLFEFATPTTSEPGLMSRLTDLKFQVNEGGSTHVRVFAYAGDGQLTLSDATAAGTLIASTTGANLKDLNLPAGLIAALGNPSHIGFRIEAVESYVSVYDVGYSSGRLAAKLESASVLASPQVTTLDFNNLLHGGVVVNGLSTYADKGYKLTGGMSIYGQSSPNYTGTGAFSTGYNTNYSNENYVLTRSDNATFVLNSLMLYKDSAESPEATVLFTGTKADGTIVQQAGTADQLAGRKITFAGFEDVISVRWERPRRYYANDTAPAYQIDNIQLQSDYPTASAVVPLPILQNSSISITEKRTDGAIGQLTATPSMPGQNLKYELMGGGSGLFALTATGEVLLSNSKGLDFEANSQYPLIVRVSDTASPSLYDIGTVTVRVTNISYDQQKTLRPVADGDYVNGIVATTLPTMNGGNGFAEYDLNGIDWSQLRTAYLSVYVDPSSELGSQYLYAYQGDGIVNASDNSRSLTWLSEYLVTGSGWQTIALNVNALRHRAGSWSHLGLRFVTGYSSGAIRLQTEEGALGGPRLTLGLWPNSAPVLNDVTWSVPEITGASLQLGATDADSGDQLTYSLVSSTLPGAFSLTPEGRLYTSNAALLDYETTPQITLVVKVTDNGLPGLSDTATITVNLTDQNEFPVVTPLTINAGTLTPGAVLGQVIATDSDPTTLTFRLGEIYYGYDKLFEIEPSTGVIRWKGGTAFDSTSTSVPATVQLSVYATDTGSPARTGNALVTVNFSDRPVAPVLPATVNLSVAENAPAGSSLGTITATDVNPGTTLVYSLSTGGDQFSIDPATGLIKTLTTFNYESGASKSITVEVRDGVYVSRRLYTVSITNVVETPVLDNSTINVLEFSPAGTLVKQLTPTFKDGGSPVTYSIVSGNVNNAFTIDSVTGKLTVTSSTSLSYVVRRIYSLTVKVADANNPLLSDTAVLTINVTRPQRPPVLPNKSFTLPENSRVGYTVGTITATDPDTWEKLTYSIESTLFEIVPTTGLIRVKAGANLDYEMGSSRGAYVTVTDGVFTAKTWVTISLTNVNEAPVVINATTSVNEFSPVGTSVATVKVSDPDVTSWWVDNSTAFTYAIAAGNSSGIFAIDALTGAINVAKPNLLNSQVTSQYVLTVRATDKGTPRLAATGTITVNVVSPAIVRVLQGTDTGGLIGQVLPAGAMGASRSFTILSGNVGEAFAVHPTTGMITVKTPGAIDILALPEYQLVVRVSDGTRQETVTRRIRVENSSVLLKTISNTQGYISTTTRDALGVPTWQTPVAGDQLVIRGGSEIQSRVMVSTSARIDWWNAAQNFLSFTVTDTVQNELTAETVIDIYAEAFYGDSLPSASSVTNGIWIGRLVLQAGDASQNKTYVIKLGGYPYDNNTPVMFSFRNNLNRNQVTIDGSAGAVRVFQLSHYNTNVPYYLDANDSGSWAIGDQYYGTILSTQTRISPARYWWTGHYGYPESGDLIGVDSSGTWSFYHVDDGSVYQRSQFSTSPVEIITSTIVTTREKLYGRDAAGDWWRLDNLYNNQFTWTKVGNWSASVNWVDVTVADFDGDGTEDFAGRNAATGQWTVMNGASFVNTTWGTWATNRNWSFVKSGDFNGDGRADLVGQTEAGDWWMSRSLGNKFVAPVLMGNWIPSDPAVEVVVGDFNFDLKSDIVGRTVSGTWLYSKSQSSAFTTTVLGYWSDPAGWDQSQVSYQYDSKGPSVVSRHRITNELWVITPERNGPTVVRDIGLFGGTDVFVPGMSTPPPPVVTTIPAPRGPLLNPPSYDVRYGEVTPNTPTVTPVIPSSTNPPANASSSWTLAPLAPFTSYNGQVVIDGDTALVPGLIGDISAVQVLVKSGSSWVSQGVLRPDVAIAEGNQWVVGLEGNVAVLSHPYNRSIAFVFERSGSTWTQTATIGNPWEYYSGKSDLQPFAIDGGRIAIPSYGVIDLYEKIASGWKKTQSFFLDDDYYVGAISLSGNRLAFQNRNEYTQNGYSVVVYEYRNGVWSRSADLPVIDSPVGDKWKEIGFGKTLTLSGDVLIVEGETYNGRSLGAVAVYEFTANGWQLVTEFKSSGNSTSFSSPQFSDNRLLMSVSTSQENKTQLYIRQSGGWQLAQEWAGASSNLALDGRSIAISGPGSSLKFITLNDSTPVITNSGATFSIPELSSIGTVVGRVIASSGPADSLTYQITGGNTGDVFAIDPVTGVITVKRGSLLDFETRPSYRIYVSVKNRDSSVRAKSGVYNVSLTNTADTVQVTSPEITVRVNGTEISSGGSLDFGEQHFNIDEVRTFVVSNTGTSDLVLQPVTVPEGFSVVSNFSAGQIIVPGGSVNLVVRFDSKAPGTTTGILRWASNDADEPTYQIQLTGTKPLLLDSGKVELSVDGTLVADGGVIDFNVITPGTPVVRTFTITNRGTGSLDLTKSYLSWNRSIDERERFTLMNNGQKVLAPGESTTFTVTYDASLSQDVYRRFRIQASYIGQDSFNVTLRGHVPGPQLEASLNGKVIRAASQISAPYYLSVPDAPGDFGLVAAGATLERDILFRNVGDRPLDLDTALTTTGPFTVLTSIPVGTVLAPGESKTIRVRFSGGADGGVYAGTLGNLPIQARVDVPEVSVRVVTSQGVSGYPSSPLRDGVGVIDFGSIRRNSTAILYFEVSNTGTKTLTLQPISVPAGYKLIGNNFTAGQTLAPGAAVTFQLQLDTQFKGTFGGEITFGTNDNNENLFNIAVTGRVVGIPVSTATLGGFPIGYQTSIDFGQSDYGTTVDKTLIVSNSGDGDLILQPMTVPAGFTVIGNFTAGQIVAPGQTASLVVRYLGTVNVNYGATVLTTDGGVFTPLLSAKYRVGGTIKVSVNGVEVPYNGRIDYGTVVWGEDAVKTFLVENTGTAVMEIYSSSVMYSDFTVPATSLFLPPGASTNLTVLLPKTSTPGLKSSTLEIRSSSSNRSYFVANLQGTVASSGEADVSVNGVAVVDNQSEVDFGGVMPGDSSERTITIKNTGTTDLRVGPANGPAGVTFLTNFTMNQVIAPGATASITVRMSADSTGRYLRRITIPNSDQDESNYEVLCEIRGRYFTPGGEIDVEINGISVADRSTLDLGKLGQGTTVVKTITVRNRGTSDLKLNPLNNQSNLTLITNFSYGQIIPAGGSASIAVQLNTSYLGNMPALFYIPNSDGDEDDFGVTLKALVVTNAPEIVVSTGGVEIADNTGSIDFGSVVSGNSISKTFTVTNAGVLDLIVQPIVVPAGFSIIGNFQKNQVIAPGASVSFTLRLSTSVVGSYSGQVAILTNDTDERPFDFRILGRVITPAT